MREPSEHVRRNRQSWDADSDAYQERNRAALGRWDRLGWGVWDLPEDDVRALGDVAGRDALEFGCGACQFGIKVGMRGARVVGLDFSEKQLRHGLRNMEETGLRFPIVLADAERVPFRDGSFDLVFCDHGAMTFADPYRTVPEVARLLRPGGLFVFNMASPVIWMTWGEGDDPPTEALRRPYFGMHRQEWGTGEDASIDFQLPFGEWIRLFRRNGFSVEDLIELRPPEGATTTYEDFAPLAWARRFPAENIWKVRKLP